MNLVERFADHIEPDKPQAPAHVRDFVAWHVGSETEFQPSDDDDVALRTYLLHLRTSGVRPTDQRLRMASLREFYTWLVSQRLIPKVPFQSFSVERPRLSPEQIRRREETLTGTGEEREIARLQALNELATQLNRSPDVQTTLDVALETLVRLMNLHTAWAFLLPTAGSRVDVAGAKPLHDFPLGAFCDLPPGLEREDCYYLSAPPDCHCQALFRAGQLKRAVNVVECTRLRDSADTEGDNRGLLFHASVPVVASERPLGIINVATDEWQFLTSTDLQLLSAVGAHVGVALERARLFDVTQEQRQRLKSELQMAGEVQVSLLPAEMPQISGFSLAADWRSALEMAGDFYDIFPLPEGRWGFVIADVSDKGAPAALYMSMVRSLIRSTPGSEESPAAALRQVNATIQAHSSSDMFVSVFYAALEPETGAFKYANAGHNPPLLRRVAGARANLMPTGPVLGVFEDLELADVAIALGSGDSLIAYTDGVPDALNPAGQEYGMTRLTAAVDSSPPARAPRLMKRLSTDLSDFIGDASPEDDITFLVLVRDPAQDSSGS
ncbi:MAG: SpoIIE family protein phosphatase [Anaerolineae bacterium]